jgi:hypothetical protein
MIERFLPSLPLSLDAVVLVVLCLISAEFGRWMSKKFVARQTSAAAEKSDAEGYVIGSVLGLFAFMVGFTFSIAVDRYDARRSWVANEATSIQAAYLRADMFDEPFRSRLQATLRAYAQIRILPEGLPDERMDRLLARSDALRQRLWEETRAAAFPVRNDDQGAYLIDAVNEVLAVGSRRELAGVTNIPGRILDSLLIYLVVSAGMLGYVAVNEPARVRVTAALLYVLMSFAVVLILDIDRPRSGSIQVSQEALQDLVRTLDAAKRPPTASP